MAWFGIVERHTPRWSARLVRLDAPSRGKAAWWLQFAAPKEIQRGETAIGVVEVAEGDPDLAPIFRYLDDNRPRQHADSDSDDADPDETAHIVRVVAGKCSSRALCGRLTRRWDGRLTDVPISDPCRACAAAAEALGLPVRDSELVRN